ncbi:MAG: type II toxin-antitoxin system RelE/ParE family toxin [Nitrospirae bacterium]|nr:type II toxin-antitoxin system RelE/ParE family toxin [Nitrospirota bacterium]MCL4457283.1 type II toxin-antitoxin system RelE/ParE family toxin [Nitrospirota bacterium]MCL5978887.1 type II toxin-antitoxin system RelE/ParE family toxin [Nitrospirota bacterium]
MPQRRRLRVPDETAELVRALHPHIKKKIKAALQAIISDPPAGKALRDELEGLRSFRVSRFRVVYKIASDSIIEIVAIGPREGIYEETLRLVRKEEGK